MQFSFSLPAVRCLKNKCICAHLCTHGRAKKEVCSGTFLARCNFKELKIDCAIDQLKPGLKSKVNGAFFLSFKERISRTHTTHVYFAYYTQRLTAAHKHVKYYKLKDYSVK